MGKTLVGGLRKLCIIVLFTMLALGLSAPAPAEMGMGGEKFKVGDKATDFTTMDLDGNQVTLSSFQGKNVVLLNFWGLRCGACIEEMPHLNAILKNFGSKGLVALAVDTDGVDAAIVKSTMEEIGLVIDSTILLDQEFTVTDTYTNFLVPLTLVIDKEGIVQYIHTGYEKGVEAEYEKAVVKALGL